MGNTPSIPTDPTRQLEVIGAGYCRTGTKSMELALEKLLDGPVMHGGTHMFGREDAYLRTMVSAYRARNRSDDAAKLKHVRALTRGFVAATDLPCLDFLPELLELYPSVKVVLVHRDPQRWWNSYGQLVGEKGSPFYWAFLTLALLPIPGWRWVPALANEGLLATRKFRVRGEGEGESQKTIEADPAELGPRYLDMYEEHVRAVVPKGRLLEMEINEGWAPLCKFLGKPVPVGVPFPRVNDAAELEQFAKGILGKVLKIWVGIFTVVGVGGWWAWSTM